MNIRISIPYLLIVFIILATTWVQTAYGQEPRTGNDTSNVSGPQNERLHEQHHEQHHGDDALEEVRVTATPLASTALEMTQSATVLTGDALDRERSSSLGETLRNMPGLSSASFGANIGRPIIRGMDASRVGVMENNLSSNDASKVSQDHAVAIEPFLADQVEVLRGPATLLYGSDTIGGVVNVRTNRIPQEPAEGPGGRALIQGDKVADERYAVGRIDTGTADFGFHADGWYRDTSDYEIPGYAETDPEPGEPLPGTLDNSAMNNHGGALGGTWFGEVWQAGVSVSSYDSEYGIPGETHSHEGEEGQGGWVPDNAIRISGMTDLGSQSVSGLADGEDAPVHIDLESARIDGEIQASNPWGGVEQFKLLLNSTNYEHTEFEGSEVGTVFSNKTSEGRVEITHAPFNMFRGVLGLQYGDEDFSALGEEAFVPPSRTNSLGLFWLEEAEFEKWRLEFGARFENTDTSTSDGRTADHSPFSTSVGALWHLDHDSHVAVNLARVQRAPGDEQLFAFGPHVATQVFEIGDPNLTTETSNSFEASYKKHAGRFTLSITGYHNDFDDFIFLADTGATEDELPVRIWTQQDAEFTGGEVELAYDIGAFRSGHWGVGAFFDAVHATLADGGYVPRIPPHRIGTSINWDRASWTAGLSWIHAASQDEIAEYETPTSGYDDVGFDLSYVLPNVGNAEWSLYLRARNLLDEEIRNHSSFLKDQAPQAGRNFIFGLQVSF